MKVSLAVAGLLAIVSWMCVSYSVRDMALPRNFYLVHDMPQQVEKKDGKADVTLETASRIEENSKSHFDMLQKNETALVAPPLSKDAEDSSTPENNRRRYVKFRKSLPHQANLQQHPLGVDGLNTSKETESSILEGGQGTNIFLEKPFKATLGNLALILGLLSLFVFVVPWMLWRTSTKERITRQEKRAEDHETEQSLMVIGGNVPLLQGLYKYEGEFLDKEFFLKDDPGGDRSKQVKVYYWDDRQGAEFEGWWFGRETDRTATYAFNPSKDDAFKAMPPPTGWQLPMGAAEDETFKVLMVQPPNVKKFEGMPKTQVCPVCKTNFAADFVEKRDYLYCSMACLEKQLQDLNPT